VLDWLFVGLVLFAVYPYVGYPAILYMLARRYPNPVVPTDSRQPSVAILIAAYNESAVIERRVQNIQDIEYPTDRWKLLIGSDGSDDDTVGIARAAAKGLPVEIIDFPTRRGKAAVVRDLLRKADAEIVVLSDANTHFERDAIGRLVRWFADATVGCVCGLLDLIPPGESGQPERRYWNFETWLKKLENRVGAVLGANGAIYAFRQHLHQALEEDVITDDFVFPMLIRDQGYRVVFEPTAIAREETAPRIADEYRRRKRIGAGNLQALRLTRRLLWVSAGWTAFAYWSHKVARWTAPVFFSVAAIVALTQLDRPVYVGLSGTVALILLLAVAGWAFERSGRRLPVAFAFPYSFVAMNLALLVGASRFFLGHRDARWERTPRTFGEKT